MKLTGDYLFDASVQHVWDALFDPAVLAAAMPGCEKLELVDGDLVGEMMIKVGPISGKFTGKVHFEDKVEPQSYKMIVDGRGAPGFVKATAVIALAAEGNATRLTYNADAQIGGKIASVGERLVDASARAIAKQSLDGLHENVKIRRAALAAKPPEPAQTVASAEPTTTPEPPPPTTTTPAYRQADAGAMAKAVAKEATKTMAPIIIIVVLVLAVVIWLLVR
jgi:carbon monoxide dehydrogenase subunit G